MSLRSKGKIQPEKSNHSTRQTRIRYDEVEIDSGGEMALYSSTRNEHFTSNIALWINWQIESNEMGFLLARALFRAIHDGPADTIELILPKEIFFCSLQKHSHIFRTRRQKRR